MLVIVGLIVWLVAGIVAIAGVPSNAGAAHPLTEICVSGYHPTGSTGTVFLFGILVGAVALLELRVLLARALRAADATPDAQSRASNVTWRSSTESATPGSNINSEPTAPRSRRRPPTTTKPESRSVITTGEAATRTARWPQPSS